MINQAGYMFPAPVLKKPVLAWGGRENHGVVTQVKKKKRTEFVSDVIQDVFVQVFRCVQ